MFYRSRCNPTNVGVKGSLVSTGAISRLFLRGEATH